MYAHPPGATRERALAHRSPIATAMTARRVGGPATAQADPGAPCPTRAPPRRTNQHDHPRGVALRGNACRVHSLILISQEALHMRFLSRDRNHADRSNDGRLHGHLRKFAAALVTGGAILALSAGVATASQPPGHKVTICHATGSATNPFVSITVDVASILNGQGHAGHADIIPAFSYTDHHGVTHSFPGQNLGTDYNGSTGAAVLANGCQIPPPPTVAADVCPNIEGSQSTVPDGDIVDANGDCVPAPTTPTTATDVCPNLAGDQATVPAGDIVDASGNCVAAPTAGQTQQPTTPAASGGGGGTATAAATTTATKHLPFTGAPTGKLALLGLMLTLLGSAGWLGGRRGGLFDQKR